MKVVSRLFVALVGAALTLQPVGAQTVAGGSLPGMGAFGGAVVVAGDQVLVGEPNNNIRPGTVYIFTQSGGSWSESGSFTAPGGEAGARRRPSSPASPGT